MIRTLFATLLAFILFIIIHFLDFHFLWPTDKVHALLWTASLGVLLFVILYAILPNETWFQTKLHLNDKHMTYWIYPLIGIFCYALLFLGYLEFYFTADRSITFRMLMIIDHEPKQSINRQQMFQRYDVSNIINRRLEDLVYGGYLEKQGNQYVLTHKGRMTLQVYRLAIELLHFDNGEKHAKH